MSIVPLIASGDGSTTFNFVGMGALPNLFTFTRASSATAFNSSGTLVTVSSDVPRFDFNPSTLQPRGLLKERARTNLCLRSQELDNASWTKVDTTITADSIASPDGGTNADLATEGTLGTAVLVTSTATISAGATVTASVFVKRGNTDWLRIQAGSASPVVNGAQTWINTATGALGTTSALGTGSGVSATVQALPNGWYRVTLTYTVTVVVASLMVINSASADNSATRVNNATYYAWGGMIVEGSDPSSYIPTTSASVTRAADIPIVSNLAQLGFNFSEGTFLVKAVQNYIPAAIRFENFVSIYTNPGGNNSYRVYRRHTTGTMRFEVFSGGVSQGFMEHAVSNGVIKHVSAYKFNDCAASANGLAVVADTSVTLPTGPVDRISLGCLAGVAGDINECGQVWFQEFSITPVRQPDAVLPIRSA